MSNLCSKRSHTIDRMFQLQQLRNVAKTFCLFDLDYCANCSQILPPTHSGKHVRCYKEALIYTLTIVTPPPRHAPIGWLGCTL